MADRAARCVAVLLLAAADSFAADPTLVTAARAAARGDCAAAQQSIQTYLRDRPDPHADAYRIVADCYSAAGQFENAKALLQQGRAKLPASPVLQRSLGELLFREDPKSGEAGWTPHVDKGPYALTPDGRPLSITVWIPLSHATPLNSCIYVLPASSDPEYRAEQRRRDVDFTQVRALPASPGDWLCWNQAILHWGSSTSRFAQEPRISMALEFQTGAIPPFNEPLIRDPESLDFDTKLRLVAKQILQYRHMYAIDPVVEALARSLLPGDAII